MNSLPHLLWKTRRKWRNISTIQNPLGPGPAGGKKISLVIYFDYEREFGYDPDKLSEHVTFDEIKVSARNGFKAIVELLRRGNIKTTWNCVGSIAEHYPDTIRELISEGHEIACHTYGHIPPLGTNSKTLSEDIQRAREIYHSRFNLHMDGFHSPEDAWSKNLIEILSLNGFSYDFAYVAGKKRVNAHFISTIKNKIFYKSRQLLRIPAVCDDWNYIADSLSPEDMLSFWKCFTDVEYIGKTIGIGFHPWVIGSEKSRINGFKKFIEHIVKSEHIQTYTGNEIQKWYRDQP